MLLSGCGINWDEAHIGSPDDCTEFCDRYLSARDSAAGGMALALLVVWAGFGIALALHARRRFWDGEALLARPRGGLLTAAAVTAVTTLAYLVALLS